MGGAGGAGGNSCARASTDDCSDSGPLVFEWRVGGKVTLPLLFDGPFSIKIDWGDGTVSRAGPLDPLDHDYGKGKTIRLVSVVGADGAEGVSFASSRPLTIRHFGGIFLSARPGQFANLNIAFDADDAPRLDRTKTLARAFFRSKVQGDLTGWDVSGIEDMSAIFEGAEFSADVSTWDTSSVVDLSGAFAAYCVEIRYEYGLPSAYKCESSPFLSDLSSWDTSRVTSLARLLRGRTEVLEAGIGQWDTSSVEDMTAIFAGADAQLDLSSWDTSRVTNLSEAFAALQLFRGDEERDLGEPLDLDDGETIGLPQLSLSVGSDGWDLSSVEDMSRLFCGRQGFFGDSVATWDTSSVLTLAEAFSGTDLDVDVRSWDVSSVRDMQGLFRKVPSCYYSTGGDWADAGWYCDTRNRPAVALAVDGWNTASLTNLSHAFEGVRSELTLSSWNTSSLTDLSYAFKNASFRSDISEWDTSKVTDLSHAFQDASFEADISGWDTSSVTTLSYAFAGSNRDDSVTCGPFNIDLSGWDLSSLTDLTGAFAYRDAPMHRGVESWNIESVTDLSSFFRGADLDLDLSAWNTGNVTDLGAAFAADYLDDGWGDETRVGRLPLGIEHWDTSKVRSLRAAFYLAYDIPDLSGWNTASVEDMSHIFYEGTIPTGLGAWDISSLETLVDAFEWTGGTSTENYDLLLIGWETTAPSRNLSLAIHARYSPAAASARASLQAKGWSIFDLGPAPTP